MGNASKDEWPCPCHSVLALFLDVRGGQKPRWPCDGFIGGFRRCWCAPTRIFPRCQCPDPRLDSDSGGPNKEQKSCCSWLADRGVSQRRTIRAHTDSAPCPDVPDLGGDPASCRYAPPLGAAGRSRGVGCISRGSRGLQFDGSRLLGGQGPFTAARPGHPSNL